MKLPTELREALEPSEAELQRLTEPLAQGLVEACAAATEPSPDELARLRPRAPARSFPLTPLLLAAAAALLLVLGWPRSAPVELVEGIRASGQAERSVQAGQLTLVEQQDGLAIYEVEPEGPSDLLVRAGEVEVMVTGTRFSVLKQGDYVEVEVFRGSVEVREGGRVHPLRAGQIWRRPRPLLAASAPELERAQRSEQPRAELHPHLEPSRPEPVTVAEPEELPGSSEDLDAFHALVTARETGGLKLAEVEAFLSTWPDSDFAGEAAVFRLELLAAGSDAQLALEEIEDWLGQHASGSRFVQVHYLRATLLRDRMKDCDAARPSYLVVAELGRGKRQAEARRYLEACSP